MASFSPEIPTQDFPSKNDLGQLRSRLRSNSTRWFFIKLVICHFSPILYLFDPKTLKQDFFFSKKPTPSLFKFRWHPNFAQKSRKFLQVAPNKNSRQTDKLTNEQTDKRTRVFHGTFILWVQKTIFFKLILKCFKKFLEVPKILLNLQEHVCIRVSFLEKNGKEVLWHSFLLWVWQSEFRCFHNTSWHIAK